MDPGKSIYEQLDYFTHKMAAAMNLPAKYLYPSTRLWLEACAPRTYQRIQSISVSGLYAVVLGKDVFDGVRRSAPAAVQQLAMIWLHQKDEDPTQFALPYDGPIDGSKCYVIVSVDEMVNAEREAKVVAEYKEEMGYTVDGLDRQTCLHYFVCNQRDSSGSSPISMKFNLTQRQLEAARAEWSAQLRAKAQKAAEKERNQIVCQSQYDLDDD